MARGNVPGPRRLRGIATRRQFLRAAGASLALVTSGCRLPAARDSAFRSDPFALGVASGSPIPDGFVLWTRLAPAPLEPGGGMPPQPVRVDWELAEDESLRKIVREGSAMALPELGHAVHVELRGLQPGRSYWYRFHSGGVASPVGRTRTAPALDASLARLRFAYASCQHYEQGYFNAYAHMVEDEPDLIVHLGDYIYETSSWGDEVRRHEGPEPVTLDGYRARYALYRSDPDLQEAHRLFPWVTTWDDHEVENDYAGDFSQDRQAPALFHARRAAAYQAYYEHQPLWGRALPRDGVARLYQRLGFGDLLEMNVLDTRQFRSDQACGASGSGGGQVVEQCAERLAPERTMLGAEQEAWLLGGLRRSTARWNVIAQQMLMAEFDQRQGPAQGYWTDGWDGYAAARGRILAVLAEGKLSNPFVIGGDIHSFWATELRADFRDPRSPVLAAEVVGTSVTSQGIPQERWAPLLAENPHVRFFESRHRGYVLCDVTRERLRADLRIVESIRQRPSPVRTLRSFVVEDGRPGLVPEG